MHKNKLHCVATMIQNNEHNALMFTYFVKPLGSCRCVTHEKHMYCCKFLNIIEAIVYIASNA